MLKLNKLIKISGWIITFEAIGFFMGLLTQANLDPWYSNLNKSSLTPPSYVFSIVWSMLYALIAIIGYDLWQNRKNIKFKELFYLYLAQLVMNFSWTPIFFQLHWIGFSFLWIIFIILINGAIIIRVRNHKKVLALALIPYFLWLIFAAYLNGIVWALN